MVTHTEFLRSIPRFQFQPGLDYAQGTYRIAGAGSLDGVYPAFLEVEWNGDELVSKALLKVSDIAMARLTLRTDDPIRYDKELTWSGHFSDGAKILSALVEDMLGYLEGGI